MAETASAIAEAPIPITNSERRDELCATTVRAISQDSSVRFRHHVLHRGQFPLPFHAPHLYPPDTDADVSSRRGGADAMAWRIALSDPQFHASVMPENPVAAILFDMLEQYRVESLGADELPGSRANLKTRFLNWSADCVTAGLLETAHGLLVFYVAQVGRSRATGDPVPDEFGDLLESTRGGLSDTVGPRFAQLRRSRHSQAEYSLPALAIANEVSALLEAGTNQTLREGSDSNRASIPGLLDFKPPVLNADDNDEQLANVAMGRGLPARRSYEIFTSKYDRELSISEVVSRTSAADYRRQLDDLVAQQPGEVSRLARALRNLLTDPQPDGWDGGQEEGLLDGRRLAQLITASTDQRIFRQPTLVPTPSAFVTFLIDCSGSMKKHREKVALLIDTFARALDQVDIGCEVLGFTTGAWSGGKARADWLRGGRPAHPGRLNEVRHLTIKDAGTSWRRARLNIASLLATDVYREGIDGEAVTWAHRRLTQHEARRRIMVVISDGSPMDSATNLANDDEYLNRHLYNVVADIENKSGTQLSALYLAAELPSCFRSSRLIDPATSTNAETVRTTLELLAGQR